MKNAWENAGRCYETSSGKESKKINRKYRVLITRQQFGLTSEYEPGAVGCWSLENLEDVVLQRCVLK